MKVEFESQKKRKLAWWIIGVVAACIFIFLAVQNIGVIADAIGWCIELVAPLLVGVAFALIINVPMRFFERFFWPKTKRKFLKVLRRPLAYIVSLVMICGILLGVIWLVIPELVDAITVIIQTALYHINRLSSMNRAEIAELPFGNVLLNADWGELLDTLQGWLKNQSGTIVNTAFTTFSSIVDGIFDLFISCVFSIYILFSKEKLKSQIRRLVHAWLPRKTGTWFIHAAAVANANLRNFISGQSLEAVILGVLCMIGMLILKLPYVPMVGALVGVTALIPVVGGFIGAIVGAFMILTISPVKAAIFVVYLIILQQIEGNLIYPKVMGSRVNLPGMWILAAVTVGGGIAGPIGMLLSVPLTSTLYTLIKESTLAREAKVSKAKVED